MLKVQYYTWVLEILFSITKWRKNSNISSMSGNGGKIKNSIVFQSLTNQITNSTLSHKVLKCCIPDVRFSNYLWFSPSSFVSQA
jgi:hypothetical protein